MSTRKYIKPPLPAVDATRQAQLQALAQQPDEAIDYSDIPPFGEEFWAQAQSNPFYKPLKIPTSVRIDADVLLWLKSQGKGYQTRINAILRDAMLRARHHKA